jgi:hypothetical protein
MCDVNDPKGAHKRFSTLQAHAALAGWVLNRIGDGDAAHYLMSRWGRSRSLPDLEAVERFLAQVEGDCRG